MRAPIRMTANRCTTRWRVSPAPAAAGARRPDRRAPTRSTASLDLENPAALKLLLQHGGNPNEPARNAPLTDWGSPLMWAIRRRRSREHVAALLDAGADPRATTPDGISAYRLALQFGLSEVAELLRGRRSRMRSRRKSNSSPPARAATRPRPGASARGGPICRRRCRRRNCGCCRTWWRRAATRVQG